jgi:hypothetical protein
MSTRSRAFPWFIEFRAKPARGAYTPTVVEIEVMLTPLNRDQIDRWAEGVAALRGRYLAELVAATVMGNIEAQGPTENIATISGSTENKGE